MSTPEKPRPSLDDTLHRIDAVIAEHAAKLDAQPTCLCCGRQSLIGSDLCAYHLQLSPLPVIAEQPGHRRSCQHDGPPGPDCPGCTEIDDLLAIAHSNAAPAPPAAEPRHLPGAPGPTCPGCVADTARPSRLARALRRLFGDGGP